MRLPPLKSIIAFESVARTKSVNRAADELGLTPSAVSHQLANLENIVGRPLFTRLGRGLVLTPTGSQYLSDVTGALAELNRATERASSGERSASVPHSGQPIVMAFRPHSTSPGSGRK